MPKLQDLELQIKQTGSISSTGIKNLSEALERLSAAAKSFPKGQASNIAEINSAIKSISVEKANAVSKLSSAISKLATDTDKVNANSAGNIAAIGAAIEQMVDGIDVGKLSSISAALEKFQQSVRGLSGTSAGAGIKAAVQSTTIKNLGDSETSRSSTSAIKEETQATEEAGQASETAAERVSIFRSAVQSMSDQMSSSSSVAGAFSSTLKSLGSATMGLGKGLLTVPWKPFKAAITGTIGKLGSLLHSFKRIAGYRLLRTAIKAITQGFSEGIKHVYEWARAVDNGFKQSMDSLATSAHYLRDSLGAMASPLLDALAPAIEVLVDKFVNLLNIVNQFIATFNGASTWRKAVKVQTEWKTGLEDTAGAAKEATAAQKKLNKAIQDFDELHVITTTETKGRTPTSSGKAAEDYSTHFEEVEVADWIEEIKKKIKSGNWEVLGQELGEKLNGIVEKFDAEGMGKKIADKVNNAFSFFNGLISTLKWSRIGIKGATFLNSLFKNISAEKVKKTIVNLVNGGLDLVKAFFRTAKWDQWALKGTEIVNGLFNGVTVKKVSDTIVSVINGAFKFLKTAILGGYKEYIDPTTGEIFTEWREGLDFKGIGDAIGTIFDDLLTDINWEDVGKTLAGLVSGLTTIITRAISKIKVKDIFDAIGDLLSGFFSDPAAIVDAVQLVGIIAGFKLLFGTAIPAAFSGLGGVVSAAFTSLFGGAEVQSAISGGVSSGLTSGLSAASTASALKAFLSTYGISLLGAIGISAAVIALVTAAPETTPEATAKQLKESGGKNPEFVHAFEDFDTDAYKDAFMKALETDADVMAAYKSALNVYTKDGTHTDKNAALAAARKKFNEKYGYDDGVSRAAADLDLVTKGADLLESTLGRLTGKEWKINLDGGQLKASTDDAARLTGKEGLGGIKSSYKTQFTATGLADGSTMSKTLVGKNGLGGLKNKYSSEVNVAHVKDGADASSLLKGNLTGINGKTYKPKLELNGYSGVKKEVDTLLSTLKNLSKNTYTAKVAVKGTGLSVASGSGKAEALEISLKADGGYVNSGDLFIANEQGPELIGTINGKTAVGSGREITGIADAVYNTGEAEASLLREQNRLLRQLLAKNNTVTLAPNAAAGRWVAQAQSAYAKATG